MLQDISILARGLPMYEKILPRFRARPSENIKAIRDTYDAQNYVLPPNTLL